MSAADRENAPIIVVRRAQEEHEEHHGGVWKIAYADFMTAMMAFFLVMWLVNASSEETKAAVASYFNPIELTDRNARPRGLDDPQPGPTEALPRADEAKGGGPGGPGGPVRKIDIQPNRASGASIRADGARTEEPMPVGAREAEDRAGPQTGASGGEAHRDPFSPDYWSRAAGEVAFEALVLGDEPRSPDDRSREQVRTDAELAADHARMEGTEADEVGPDGVAEPESETTATSEGPDASSDAAGEATRALADEIAGELGDLVRAADIDVIPEAGEVVIRLADDPDRAMFPSGSASPSAGLAGDLARIAAVLDARSGAVSVHGHTDARPFAGDPGGNWRLSADRAEAARRLLVSGGLSARRVVEVVAHAERRPRQGLAPEADGNRRIELRIAVGADR